jgi:hypothetical protein
LRSSCSAHIGRVASGACGRTTARQLGVVALRECFARRPLIQRAPLSHRGPFARGSVFSFGRANTGPDTVNIELTARRPLSIPALNSGDWRWRPSVAHSSLTSGRNDPRLGWPRSHIAPSIQFLPLLVALKDAWKRLWKKSFHRGLVD